MLVLQHSHTDEAGVIHVDASLERGAGMPPPQLPRLRQVQRVQRAASSGIDNCTIGSTIAVADGEEVQQVVERPPPPKLPCPHCDRVYTNLGHFQR